MMAMGVNAPQGRSGAEEGFSIEDGLGFRLAQGLKEIWRQVLKPCPLVGSSKLHMEFEADGYVRLPQ